MGYITQGTEWQVRALADAAETFAQAAPSGSPDRLYGQGFADALTFILGEMKEAETPTQVTVIYQRYLDIVDPPGAPPF